MAMTYHLDVVSAEQQMFSGNDLPPGRRQRRATNVLWSGRENPGNG